MAAVGTWAFSARAVERLKELISAGHQATDAVEDALAEVENDPETGRHIVGRGGFPNSRGVLECDAAIMEGKAGRFGAVAALQGMAAVGTWAFSARAVERLKELISAGHQATDAVEDALAEVENDPETGRHIVGRGGFPNSRGVLECDAAIMEGKAGRFGAVAALQGVGAPIRVARRVMDKSPHSLLVGEGAVAFASEQGFAIEPNDNMLTTNSAMAYQEYLEKKQRISGHDTLGLIAVDTTGNITVGVSSSGAPFKAPGRVGDSPLPGCGLYAEHMVGAAAATGDGDKIMCFCPSFHIVQLMKQGSAPSVACRTVLDDIMRRIASDSCFEIGLIAVNTKGEVGAASTVEFPYAFWNQDMVAVEICTNHPHSIRDGEGNGKVWSDDNKKK